MDTLNSKGYNWRRQANSSLPMCNTRNRCNFVTRLVMNSVQEKTDPAGPWEYGKWWENYDSKLEMLLKLIDKGIDEENSKAGTFTLVPWIKVKYPTSSLNVTVKLDEYWESRQPVVTYSDPRRLQRFDFEADEWTVLDMLSNGMTKAQIKRIIRLHRKFGITLRNGLDGIRRKRGWTGGKRG